MSRKLIRWTVKDVADVIDKCIFNDFDCIIMVEGGTGIGKSTLTYKICRKIKSCKFRLKKSLVYDKKDILRLIANERNTVIWADEMINAAYKREFYNKDQIQIIKGLNMFRDSNNIFFGDVPFFMDLDPDFRKLCKIRISVVRKGFALIHRPIKSFYSTDPWDTKKNAKIEESWSKRGVSKPKYSRLSTVVGFVTFGPMNDKQKDYYKKMKRLKRGKVYVDESGLDLELEKAREFIDRLMDKVIKNEYTKKELRKIAHLQGMTYAKLAAQMKGWLKRHKYTKGLNHYVNDGNKVVKKDALGFDVLE